MAVDRRPRFWIYASTRLLKSLYMEDQAARGRIRNFKITPTVRSPVGDLQLSGASSDITTNIYELASYVTDAVGDNTGDLVYPGLYVRAELTLTWCLVTFEEGPRGEGLLSGQKVAWMYATEETDEGAVNVVLCGSPSNYLSFSDGGKPYTLDGWTPSSPEGLSTLVLELALKGEPDQQRVRQGFLDSPEEYVKEILRASRNFSKFAIGRARVDTLLEVFGYVANFETEEYHYRAVIVGAPLWITTIPPKRVVERGRDKASFDDTVGSATRPEIGDAKGLVESKALRRDWGGRRIWRRLWRRSS